jgi:hypothetical protein
MNLSMTEVWFSECVRFFGLLCSVRIVGVRQWAHRVMATFVGTPTPVGN